MDRKKVFLTAEWVNLLMLNYAVDPALLLPLVPAGTKLDEFDGRPYVSLIGFEFNDTRVLGFSVPFHRSFLEVNLRFYVRRGEKRGVAFLREFVPLRMVAAIARWAFNENYSSVPMAHSIKENSNRSGIHAEYSWGAGTQNCSMRLDTVGRATVPESDSLAQFITEHYWGYAAQRDGGCIEYEVQHPQWPVWQAKDASFIGESSSFYREDFSNILTRPPDSAFLAVGSAVTVSKGMRII
jgi:uncharacterized protein